MRADMTYVILIGVLIYLSFVDIKKRRINVKMCMAVIGGGVVISIYEAAMAEKMPVEILYGVIPGIICLLVAFMSREQIGYGDGMIVLGVGLLLGGSKTIEVLCLGLFITAVVSILLLMIRKIGRRTRIPFIPFLTMGVIISYGMHIT